MLVLVVCSLFSCVSKTQSATKTIAPPSLVRVTGDYQKVSDVKDLPPAIMGYFNKSPYEIPMVNSQSEFKSSRFATLLVSAGNAGDVWFLEFYTGGTGVSHTFLGFRLKENAVASIKPIIFSNKLIALSIDDLVSLMPVKAECVSQKVNYTQWIYETGYGLCKNH